MATSYHVALFLFALAYCSSFCVTFTSAKFEPIEVTTEPKASIQLHVALPWNAKPVNFTCTSGGFVIRPPANHDWIVPINQIEACHAIWGHSSASFSAYDPQIDIGHSTVFLLAKLDGFFHGWDNSTWDKKTGWDSPPPVRKLLTGN